MPQYFYYTGLKCDNSSCNYRDDSVPYEAYPMSVGKPCPNCGESLLTLKDYERTVKLVNSINAVLNVFALLRFINPFFYLRKLTGRKPVETTFQYRLKKKTK